MCSDIFSQIFDIPVFKYIREMSRGNLRNVVYGRIQNILLLSFKDAIKYIREMSRVNLRNVGYGRI